MHGNIIQGKCMLAFAGVVLLLFFAVLFHSQSDFLRGAMIPIALFVVINIIYPLYLLKSSAELEITILARYSQNPNKTIIRELSKAKADDRSYLVTRCLWSVLLLAAVVSSFVVSGEYWKGSSIGFAALFFGLLLIDTLFQSRLKYYLQYLLAPY